MFLNVAASTSSYRKYGFNELFENVFRSFEDCSDIIENPVPDENTVDPWGMCKVIRVNSRIDETNGGIQV